MIDDIVEAIVKSLKSNIEESCEALLTGLYYKYQDAFFSVVLNNEVASLKVMDEVSVEAMLSEATVNWTNGRILFQWLESVL